MWNGYAILVNLPIFHYNRSFILFYFLLKATFLRLLLLLSCSVVSDSLLSLGLQYYRLPCPSLSPGVCLNSCPLNPWCIQPSYSLFLIVLWSFQLFFWLRIVWYVIFNISFLTFLYLKQVFVYILYRLCLSPSLTFLHNLNISVHSLEYLSHLHLMQMFIWLHLNHHLPFNLYVYNMFFFFFPAYIWIILMVCDYILSALLEYYLWLFL